MFTKSTVLLPYNNSLKTLHPPGQTSRLLLFCSHSHRHVSTASHQQCRSYAMVSDGHCRHDHGSHRWPEVTSASAIPTPYQIFNQRKGSPYSKHRFYELVKLYHPDRHDSHDGLSYATKLERYRLIVAANNILSDPVKRGAYDCYGAGWNGMPDVVRKSQGGWGEGGNGWGSSPNGPSQNATWEDWERWYAREAEGPQGPRFVSNRVFVGLICILAGFGCIGQATRVGNFSAGFVEQRDALHDNISKDLMRRRRETANSLANREERILKFLKQRDPHGYGGVGPRDEAYHKLLPNPEVCSSEDIKSRGVDIFNTSSNSKGEG